MKGQPGTGHCLSPAAARCRTSHGTAAAARRGARIHVPCWRRRAGVERPAGRHRAAQDGHLRTSAQHAAAGKLRCWRPPAARAWGRCPACPRWRNRAIPATKLSVDRFGSDRGMPGGGRAGAVGCRRRALSRCRAWSSAPQRRYRDCAWRTRTPGRLSPRNCQRTRVVAAGEAGATFQREKRAD